MPFSINCDHAFWEYILNCHLYKKNILQFPSLDIMYLFIKKPLDYYIGNNNGILNLNIYKFRKRSKLFDTNIQFLIDGHAWRVFKENLSMIKEYENLYKYIYYNFIFSYFKIKK